MSLLLASLDCIYIDDLVPIMKHSVLVHEMIHTSYSVVQMAFCRDAQVQMNKQCWVRVLPLESKHSQHIPCGASSLLHPVGVLAEAEAAR